MNLNEEIIDKKDYTININESIYPNNYQLFDYLDCEFPLIDHFSLLINNKKNPIFKINYEPRKKRGRHYNVIEENNVNKKIHNKYSKDNIRRRIKVHFFKFIIQLCNDYIKKICKKKSLNLKKLNVIK